MRVRTRGAAVLAALAAMTLASSASVALTEAALPGGTQISIDNTSPVDGTSYLIPQDQTTLDVTDTGVATVGGATVDKNTSLVYVIDRSGSTSQTAGVNCDGTPGNDSVLLCEKVAATAVNTAAADAGSVIADVAVVSYADAALVNYALGDDFPAAGAAINGLAAGGLTNYQAAVQAAQTQLAASTETNKIVVFLSDGFPTTGSLVGVAPIDAVVYAFAVGAPANVSCSGGPPGQNLNAVAALGQGGSSCQQVADPSTLASVIATAVGTSLDSVEIDVDGGGYGAIPAGDLDIALPTVTDLTGKDAEWSTVVTDLGTGQHEICVRASGTDSGGAGTVEECKTIRLLQLQADSDLEATNELGTDNSHTVSVLVAGDAGGTDVTFEVAGVNDGEGEVVVTDGDGKASFTFMSPQTPDGLGTDTIEVTITVGEESQSLTFTKHWVDTTPPAGTCEPSVNPGGKEPKAPGKGGQGQNQDGFYLVGGSDDIWPDGGLEVYVTDTGSGHVFGPYAAGTNIKYTQAPGAQPSEKTMGGPNSAVQVQLKGTGDAEVTVEDGSGNVSEAVSCLVPPPPM